MLNRENFILLQEFCRIDINANVSVEQPTFHQFCDNCFSTISIIHSDMNQKMNWLSQTIYIFVVTIPKYLLLFNLKY